MRTGLWALLAAAAALCGCTQPPVPPEPSVSVRELDNGNWQATWRFTAPARGLRFERPAHYFREQHWVVVTPGYALARDGDSQVIVHDVAYPSAAEITVEFPVDTNRFPREYEFFHRFTDGSLAFYTGMLYAETLDGATAVRKVHIEPGAGRRLVLLGEVFGAPATWTDPGSMGTYAYIGNIEPVRTDHMTAVFDPGLPEWIAYEARQRIAGFFRTLAERTGHPLNDTPLVLFNFVPGGVGGYEYRGGALPGLIHLNATGDGWHGADPHAVRGMLRFVAHEAAHLWNSGKVMHFAPGTPAWLHEGSADALAERLLVVADIVRAEALDESMEHALNECINIPGWAPLSGTRASRAHYACGNVVASWSERLLQAADPQLDLFGFIGRLIDHAQGHGGVYTEDDWFTVLESMGADSVAVDAMLAFVRGAHTEPGAAWQRVLQSGGILIDRDDASADRAALRRATGAVLMALLAEDCDGRYGFYSIDEGFELAGLGDCGNARDGTRIVELAGVPVDAPAFGAARATAAQCAAQQQVHIGDMILKCPVTLPQPTGYWVLRSEIR